MKLFPIVIVGGQQWECHRDKTIWSKFFSSWFVVIDQIESNEKVNKQRLGKFFRFVINISTMVNQGL